LLLFGGVLFIGNRGVGFELHGEVKLMTMFGGKMKIGCREKKVNCFEKFRERRSVKRVQIDMIAVSCMKRDVLKKTA
jgi:hypothetical protein